MHAEGRWRQRADEEQEDKKRELDDRMRKDCRREAVRQRRRDKGMEPEEAIVVEHGAK